MTRRSYQRRNAISPSSIESIVIREVARNHSIPSEGNIEFHIKSDNQLGTIKEKGHIFTPQGAAAA
jgi:hypothetical protein